MLFCEKKWVDLRYCMYFCTVPYTTLFCSETVVALFQEYWYAILINMKKVEKFEQTLRRIMSDKHKQIEGTSILTDYLRCKMLTCDVGQVWFNTPKYLELRWDGRQKLYFLNFILMTEMWSRGHLKVKFVLRAPPPTPVGSLWPPEVFCIANLTYARGKNQ